MPDWGPDLRRRLPDTPLSHARRSEILEELSQHLDEHYRELIDGGVHAGEAERLTRLELERASRLQLRLRHAAQQRRQFSSLGAVVTSWIASIAQDARFAARLFIRRAGVMSLALGGLAAAIALGTVMFGALNAIAFRPMGVPEPERAVHVYRFTGNLEGWTPAAYQRLRDAATRFRPEAWWSRPAPASPDFDLRWHETAMIQFVSETFLETFGGRVAHGRLLSIDDHAASAPVRAVVSHTFWATRLRRDLAVVGRTVTLGTTPVTIVGVAAREFGGPSAHWDAPAAFWMPLAKRGAFETRPIATSEAERPVAVIAMLATADGAAAAESEASAIAAADAAAPALKQEVRMRPVDASFDDDDWMAIGLTLAVVALLLLQAYANVANLLLAGASVRRPEIAARLAMGASRSRVARQLLTESLLLGIGAGFAGALLASWIGPALAHLAWIPPTVDLSMDWRVFTFVAVASAGAALLCGVAVARQALSGNMSATLKSGSSIGGSRSSARLRHAFVGVQAATSMLLLVAASLFTRALVESTWGGGGRGLALEPLASVIADLGVKDEALHRTLRLEALHRLRALPDVEAVAVARGVPFVGGFEPLRRGVGEPRSLMTVIRNHVSAEYFAALGARVQRGRVFTDDDVRQRAPLAVVTVALVRRYWPDGDALGATLGRVHPDLANVSIVGIIDDMMTTLRQSSAPGIVHLPLTDVLEGRHFLVRARGDASALTAPMQAALQAMGPGIALRVRTLREEIERDVGPVRMVASVTAILAVFTLVLAALGLVGVTAFAVQQRTREIGVRLALGASRDRMLRLLLRQSLRPVAIGLGVGVVFALAASGLVANMLYGIGPRDPMAVGGAIGVLSVAALLAVIVPSSRATRLDPARVLRE
jgi:predicted permease